MWVRGEIEAKYARIIHIRGWCAGDDVKYANVCGSFIFRRREPKRRTTAKDGLEKRLFEGDLRFSFK